MTTPIRIRTAQDVLAAVPALLGFHPRNSLVALGLGEGNGRVKMTARLDLPFYYRQPGRAARQIAEGLKRNGSVSTIIVFYGAPIDDVAELMFWQEDLIVRDVIATGNEPYQVNTELEGRLIETGHSMLPRREDLTASVSHREGVTVPNLDVLLFPMATAVERDRAMVAAVEHHKEVLPTLITACQAVSDDQYPQVVNLLVTCGIAAYRKGDGALTVELLARAMRISPQHRMANLLWGMVVHGAPKEDLDKLAEDMSSILADMPETWSSKEWLAAAGAPQ